MKALRIGIYTFLVIVTSIQSADALDTESQRPKIWGIAKAFPRQK